MGMAAMPTQDGDGPGFTSACPAAGRSRSARTAEDPQAAFDFITMALNKENTLQVRHREQPDRGAQGRRRGPGVPRSNPSFASSPTLVDVTHFRPATPDYPQISSSIQVADRGRHDRQQQSPEDAAAAYDDAVTGIVGDDNTTTD